MTAKKKKPFWVKLLSAVLVASMLMGSAGISSFAASDSPDGKTGVEEPVSNESAGDEKNTAETPETSAANEAAQDLEDTGKTGAGEDTKTAEDADVSDTEGNLQSKEEAGTSDVEDNQQSKEEAGTSDVEESLKDKAEGDISSETGDENAPSDETDTENGGVTPGTADAEEETEELPETESVYASLEEFLAAVAAVGEVDEVEDLLGAIDICLDIYGRLSPEDKKAQSEAYEYIAEYREQVAAGKPDEGVETLALVAGHPVEINVHKVIKGKSGYVDMKKLNLTCAYTTGHSSGNCVVPVSAFRPSALGWSETGWRGWRKDQYGYYSSGDATINKNASGNFMVTVSNNGAGGVRSWDTIYLVYDPVYTITYLDGYSGNKVAVYEDVAEGTATPKPADPTREGYVFKGWKPGVAATVTEDATYTAQWEEEQQYYYYARVLYNSNADGDTVTGMPGEYKYVGINKSPTYTLSGNIPARSGYIFKGWSTANGENNAANKVSGSVTLNTSTTPDGPIHRYYAIWEPANVDNGKGITITKTRVSINDDEKKSTAEPGDEIKWNITVTNNSNVMKKITLKERLPGAILSESSFELAAGASKTVVARYTVKRADNGTKIVNTVDASTGVTGEEESASDPGTTVGAEEKPNISVTKTPEKTAYTEGDDISWNITVTNNGNSSVSGLKLEDILKKDGNSFTGNIEITPPNNLNGTRDAFTLAAKDSVTFKATIEGAEAGTYSNAAVVKKDTDELDRDTATDVVVTKPIKTVDRPITFNIIFESKDSNRKLAKSDVPTDFKLILTYTDGEGTEHVKELTYNQATLGESESSGHPMLTWAPITVKVPDVSGARVKINVKQEGYIVGNNDKFIWERSSLADGGKMEEGTGVAYVSRGSYDTKVWGHNYYSLPKDTATTLKVTKTADKDEAFKGDTVVYTIKVENTGSNAAKNVKITDLLPNGLQLVTDNENGPKLNGKPITPTNSVYVIGDLAANATATLVLTAKVTAEAGTELVNIAAASYDNKPTGESDPAGEKHIDVVEKPADHKLTVHYYWAGAEEQYKKVAEDYTSTLASGASYTVNVPRPAKAFKYVVKVDSTEIGNVITGIMPDEDKVITVYYTPLVKVEHWYRTNGEWTRKWYGDTTEKELAFDSALQNAMTGVKRYSSWPTYKETYTYRGWYSETNPAPDYKLPGNPADMNYQPTIIQWYERKLNINVEKTADKETVAAGNNIVYIITVTNAGSDTAWGVTVSDTLDGDKLEFVSWRLNNGAESSDEPADGVYSIGDIEAGNDSILYITAKVKDTEAAEISNTATADYSNKPNNDPGTLESEKKVTVVAEDQYTVKIQYVDDSNPARILQEELIAILKDGENYIVSSDKILEELTVGENHYIKAGEPSGALTGTINGRDIVITIPYTLDNNTEPENPTDPTEPVIPGGGDGGDPDPTPTPPGGGGGGTNPEPTPATPEPTPTTPEPTPIVPEPVPTVGPVQTVPTVTPVAPTSTVPTPTAALASPTPEMAELSDEDVPLAGEGEKEEPETVIKPAELEDEAVPMAAGKGLSWALINFALMNLAVFESLMLLIGYFIKTKGSSEEDEEEKKKLKKKGIMRIISLPVAVISVIAFILTEDITLPTAFVDRYTIWMAVIAIVQTAVVALSRKEVNDEEEQKAEA